MPDIKTDILLGAIFLLVVLSGWLYVTRSHDEVLLAGDQELISKLDDANNAWAAQVKKANADLKSITDADAARSLAAAKAIAAAHKKATDAYAIAAKLSAAKPDQTDDCKAANDFLNTYLGAVQ